MIISDAFGIIVGKGMGRCIPERFIKWTAALVFIAFGVYGLCENLPKHIWSPAVITTGLAALAAGMYAIARSGAKKERRLHVCDAGEGSPGREETETK